MREIKYRGLSLFGKHQFIYGSLLILNGKYYICPTTSEKWNMSEFEVIPETVGQFIGLFDRNGKEIYEGDIDADKLNRHHIVEYHHGGFWISSIGIGYTERLHDDRQIEIIGNIYDNPELLT